MPQVYPKKFVQTYFVSTTLFLVDVALAGIIKRHTHITYTRIHWDLRNIPGQHKSHLLRVGCLKARTYRSLWAFTLIIFLGLFGYNLHSFLATSSINEVCFNLFEFSELHLLPYDGIINNYLGQWHKYVHHQYGVMCYQRRCSEKYNFETTDFFAQSPALTPPDLFLLNSGTGSASHLTDSLLHEKREVHVS